MPPPKSQNQRQLRKRYSSNGCSRRPQKPLPVDRRGIDVVLVADPSRAVAVPGEVYFVDLAQLAGTNDLEGLLELRHAPLLRPHLHHAGVAILGVDGGGGFGGVVRQRLFDVHVLAGRAGVDRDRHVLMVGRGNDHRVDVVAVEKCPVVLGGKGAGFGQRAAGLEVFVPDVADGRDPRERHFLERRHQLPAAPAGADAADVDGLAGREAARRGRQPGQCQARGKAELFEKLAAILRSVHGGVRPSSTLVPTDRRSRSVSAPAG